MITGGDKLIQNLAKTATKLGHATEVRVGFLEGAASYPDGTPVAQVAFWQEFGTRSIPPRPFFRNMIKEKGPTWGPAVANLLKKYDYDTEKVLKMVGLSIASQLQDSIEEFLSPPLSAVTLMLRKMRADDPGLVVSGKTVGIAASKVAAGDSYAGVSTKPLVDSGLMLNNVDFEVV